jgi:alkane 1-monooxygenase
MFRLKALPYLSFLTIPLTLLVCFTSRGWWTYLPLGYAFGFIPLLELFLKKDSTNPEKEEEQRRQSDPIYDWILYLAVPIQYTFLLFFLFSVSQPDLMPFETTGRVLGMGVLCGILGINVAHELGHRHSALEQIMAKALLLTSLYMHFFIEHNRGHHKNVSTDQDPASARYGEILYAFWIRSIIGSYISAWRIETARLKKKNQAFFSLHNEMLWYFLMQGGLVLLIGLEFGFTVAAYFVAAATFGILLLETVNYIEHYGLSRKKLKEGMERVKPGHSWNSDHVVGRRMLFELSRHSDHHFIASRKYQLLRHHPNSPQMPTGYPGMMLLAMVPPLWFAIMHQHPALKGIEKREVGNA